MNTWPIKTCDRSNHGEELAKKMQKKIIAQEILTESKPDMTPKKIKTCICAPTSHEGSFRCHLHRKIGTPKSSSSLTKSKIYLQEDAKIHHGHHQPQLSRFSKVPDK